MAHDKRSNPEQALDKAVGRMSEAAGRAREANLCAKSANGSTVQEAR